MVFGAGSGPHWRAVAKASIEGDLHVNEDTAGFSGPIAWVIDGATPLWDSIGLPGPSDPSWYAAEFARLLRDTDLERLGHAGPAQMHDGGVPTSHTPGWLARGVLYDALSRMDTLAESLVGGELELFPSAAVTVAVATPEGVELAALADCQAVVLGSGGKVSHFGAGVLDADMLGSGAPDSGVPDSSALRAGSPDSVVLGSNLPTKAREETTFGEDSGLKRSEQRERDRRARNQPGTVWVARREPEAAEHARMAFFPDATGLVLASDGAWRSVELGLTSVSEFAQRATRQPALVEMLTTLRVAQDARGEVADDSTIISLKL